MVVDDTLVGILSTSDVLGTRDRGAANGEEPGLTPWLGLRAE